MSSTKVEYKNKIEWHNAIGQRHRVDGPALELDDGSYSWWQNGLLHREDGPATSTGLYCLYGKILAKDNWQKEVLKLKLKRLSEL